MATTPPPPDTSRPAPALPPAGDARRDALKQRDDDLAEAVEAASDGVGAIDPSKLDVDRELAFEIVDRNTLAVSNARDEYRYVWIRAFDLNGRPILGPVQEKETIRVRDKSGYVTPVWEVVKGRGKSTPEAMESIDANGWRRLGDCILMRARRDVLDALDAFERAEAERFAHQHEATIDELSARSGGVIQRSDTGGMHPRDWARARATFARQGATKVFDKMLREGTVPNMPAPPVTR